MLAGCGAAPVVRVTRPIAAARGQVDVSRARGVQNEVSVAVDPSNERILVAGSNDDSSDKTRVYGSTDGGATWTSAPGPPAPEGWPGCSSDPTVAIDRHGTQYFASLRSSPCTDDGHSKVFVARRDGPGERWRTPAAPVSAGVKEDDKPVLTVDVSPASPHEGRLYVAWTRFLRAEVAAVFISHSDDRGNTWSRPVKVSDATSNPSFATLAIGRKGQLYVAWDETYLHRIEVDRSLDGGDHFGRDHLVGTYLALGPGRCGWDQGTAIPAARLNCVMPNPIVSVDTSTDSFSGRVYITHGTPTKNGSEDVLVAALDGSLRGVVGSPAHRLPHRVNPPDRGYRSDQFFPVSAVDEATGALWACFYDTSGDRTRVRAWYSCTVSLDGGRTWPRPTRVASVPSNETLPGAEKQDFPKEYGDYEGLAVADGVAHPMWTDSRRLRRLREEIYTTAVVRSRLRVAR